MAALPSMTQDDAALEENVENLLWSLVPWGYRFLLHLEGLRTGWLNAIALAATDLGSTTAAILVVTLVYWCVHKSTGQQLAYLYLLSATLNTWIKDLTRIPRPDSPALDPILQRAGIHDRVHPLSQESSFSFISGHTQGATVAWGYLASLVKKAWFWVLAVVLVALIGFSRMYLGVHFPQDVIGGLIVGVPYLAAWLLVTPYLLPRIGRLPTRWKYALSGLIPVGLLLIDPVQYTAQAMGAAIGLGVGFILESQTSRFTVEGDWRRRVLRGALGLVVILSIRYGLGLFPGGEGQDALSVLRRTVEFALIGIVVAWLVPWLFVRLKLADQCPPPTAPEV
jgi:membrane-associated phospholipid phosphatase